MKNQIKTVLLLGTLSVLLVAIGGALGSGYLYGFAALALLMNLGAYFFSDRIVLAMHHAKEVGPSDAPALHRIVDDIAHRARIPKPRVFVIPEAQPNAFATGRNPEHGVSMPRRRMRKPSQMRASMRAETILGISQTFDPRESRSAGERWSARG
jgi:heat shock protein HtpX